MDVLNEKNRKFNITLLVCGVFVILFLLADILFFSTPKQKPAPVKETKKETEAVMAQSNAVEEEVVIPELTGIELEIAQKTEQAASVIFNYHGVAKEDELSKSDFVKYEMAINYVENLYLKNGIGDISDVLAENYLSEYYQTQMTLTDQTQVMIDVPYISQEGILPNGCESVSATMLLQFCGYSMTAEKFVDVCLPCLPYEKVGGAAYAPDPNEYYVGDPRDEKWGYGCYAPVIVYSLNKYLSSKEHTAVNISGTSMSELRDNYLEEGIPVAVWVTVNFEKITKYLPWYNNDTGELILYPANLHCMVLCGYDGENYIFNDPYNTSGVVKYPIKTVNEIYNSMGMQAVAVIKDKK